MAKLEIKLNIAGLDELRRSEEIYAECEKYANQIAEQADGEFEVERRGKVKRHYATVLSKDGKTIGRQYSITPNIHDILMSRLIK